MSDAATAANSGSQVPEDRFAAGLRGFGALGILAVLVIAAGQLLPPLSALLVLVWTRLSRTPWREIGYVRPKSWIGSLLIGVAFGVLFKFLMKAIVMPLLGANPINQAYHYLDWKLGRAPGRCVHHDCHRGLRGRDRIPRVHVRTTR